MSGAAKFLMVTMGGGLLLGAIGSHFTRPVMLERAGDEPWRHMLEADATGASATLADNVPPDPRPYGGRRSYAPAFADEPLQAWNDPYPAPEWLEYAEEWPEPPTLAELDARWESEPPEPSAYGRTVEFPPPSAAETAVRAQDAAEDARAATGTAKAEPLPPEPRIARGELPAI